MLVGQKNVARGKVSHWISDGPKPSNLVDCSPNRGYELALVGGPVRICYSIEEATIWTSAHPHVA